MANSVYVHNHLHTLLLNNNVEKLSVEMIGKLEVNTILMSPPCQPYTRVGNRKDSQDKRSTALLHICSILPECTTVRYLLMENVKGFENSDVHTIFINALQQSGFHYREFILTPTQLGIPNTRHRYYCLARKGLDFPFDGSIIWKEYPFDNNGKSYENIKLHDILDESNAITDDLYLNKETLERRLHLMDVACIESSNTMCFTKAYSHYVEGTGSIFCPLKSNEMLTIFSKLKSIESSSNLDEESTLKSKLLTSLQLRYFSPGEIARLMCFPETFEFPPQINKRQKYRLLGNSINIHVVGELIKLLLKQP